MTNKNDLIKKNIDFNEIVFDANQKVWQVLKKVT